MSTELATRLDKLAVEISELRKLVVSDRMQGNPNASPVLPVNLYPRITKVVAERLDVSLEAIFGPSRIRNVVDARHVAMWICYQVPRSTLVEIGVYFGKDHGSVHHAVAHIHGERALGSVFGHLADQLLTRCQKEFGFTAKL